MNIIFKAQIIKKAIKLILSITLSIAVLLADPLVITVIAQEITPAINSSTPTATPIPASPAGQTTHTPAPDSSTPTPSPIIPTSTPIILPSPFTEEITITPSATTIPTPTLYSVSPTPALSSIPFIEASLEPEISTTPEANTSASIRKTVKVHPLTKKFFATDENISITVENATAANISFTLTDPLGHKGTVPIVKNESDNRTVYEIKSSYVHIPGKYVLEIASGQDILKREEFYWGTFTLNIDTTTLTPGKSAGLSIITLNDQGMPDCESIVTLIMKTGFGTTEDIPVDKNQKCKNPDGLNMPTHTARYQFTHTGTYRIIARYQSGDKSQEISEEIVVRKDPLPFTLTRRSTTASQPGENVPVLLEITARENFQGTISDTVPAGFEILPVKDAKQFDIVQKDTSTRPLTKPFNGNFPTTANFGSYVEDPMLREKYTAFGLAGHDGIDYGVPMETPILATDDGVVILSGEGVYGKTVVIEHSWGRSYYGHLSKTTNILGQPVKVGQKIGLSGNTGLSTGPHLHFGIKLTNNDMHNGYYGKIDPLPYLQGSQSLVGSSIQKVNWEVTLSAGDRVVLGYSYTIPLVIPRLYRFGPVDFTPLHKDAPAFSQEYPWITAVYKPAVETQQVADTVSINPDATAVSQHLISKIRKDKTHLNLVENKKDLYFISSSTDVYQWELSHPSGSKYGFGRKQNEKIEPVVQLRNSEGWFIRFSMTDTATLSGKLSKKVTPSVFENEISWDSAPGLISRFTIQEDRIKAEYIIENNNILQAVENHLDFDVAYNDDYAGDYGEFLKDGKGYLTHELTKEGEIRWLGENGWPYYVHPVPVIKDKNGKEFSGSYTITKTSKGRSTLSILIPENVATDAVFPIIVDPVTIDSAASATGTAYGNGRKILRDSYGNLIALMDGGTGNDNVYSKDYNGTTWTDEAIDLDTGAGSSTEIAADLDSSGNIHVAFRNSTDSDLSYVKVTVTRAGDNTITSMSAGSVFDLDLATTQAEARRPSLIVANKGEGSVEEKVAVAWASNSTGGGTRRGEIRFAQCDVADGCNTDTNWKNASEEKNLGGGTCSADTGGVPNGRTCSGGADVLFNVTGTHTTHHGVLTQVPGRPARTPTSAKLFDGPTSTYSNLTNAIDDNTGSSSDISGFAGSEVTPDFLYIGDDVKFSRVVIDLVNTNTDLATTTIQYCSANSDPTTTCDTWSAVFDPVDNAGGDISLAFTYDGSILFNEPSTWAIATHDSAQKYWIRITIGSTDFLITVSVGEFDVTDRHSKDLMIVGGDNISDDLGTAYVIWDFTNQGRWELDNSTGTAPWREYSLAIDTLGGNWGEISNFPLSTTTDYINNATYVTYHFCSGSSCSSGSSLQVIYITNKLSPLITSNWTNTSFGVITEGLDMALSMTSDQNDIYLFYVLDPGTNSLVFRKCNPAGGGTTTICDNSSDWGSEKTLVNFVAADEIQSHPQAVVSKAFGDTVAIDVVYTDTNDTSVEYERHFVDMADKTVTVAASADDAYHIDCDIDANGESQNIINTTLKLGRVAGDVDCSNPDDNSENHPGFRFPNVTVAQGAAISSAYLDFAVSARSGTGTIEFTIYGEDDNNAVTDGTGFDILVLASSTNTNLIKNLTRTTNSVSQSVNLQPNRYRFDVTDIVQEIVCQGVASAQPCVGNYFEDSGEEWASGNAIAILLISGESGSSTNLASIIAFDDTSTTTLDPTLQINTGSASKIYSMGEVRALPTGSGSFTDLDHPLSSTQFTSINTDDSDYLKLGVTSDHIQSSPYPVFLLKALATLDGNTFPTTAKAIVKSNVPATSEPIYLQIYRGGTTNDWVTVDSDTTSKADTDITLSSAVVTSNMTDYYTLQSGTTNQYWTNWRIYQDNPTTIYSEILSVDYFAVGPSSIDDLMRHGNFFFEDVEQSFTF